jgi:hypothetical protein
VIPITAPARTAADEASDACFATRSAICKVFFFFFFF